MKSVPVLNFVASIKGLVVATRRREGRVGVTQIRVLQVEHRASKKLQIHSVAERSLLAQFITILTRQHLANFAASVHDVFNDNSG